MTVRVKFIPSVAAAAQTNTDKNGTGQRGDDDEHHTYPIVVADKKRGDT